MHTVCGVKRASRLITQARVTNAYVLQTVDTAPFYRRSASNQRIMDTARIMLLSVIVCTIEVFPPRLRTGVSDSEYGAYVPTFRPFLVALR